MLLCIGVFIFQFNTNVFLANSHHFANHKAFFLVWYKDQTCLTDCLLIVFKVGISHDFGTSNVHCCKQGMTSKADTVLPDSEVGLDRSI